LAGFGWNLSQVLAVVKECSRSAGCGAGCNKRHGARRHAGQRYLALAAVAVSPADVSFREALGATFSDYYATSRRWELKAFQQTVTAWERSRYERGV